MKKNILLISSLLLSNAMIGTLAAETFTLTQADQNNLSITLYSNDLALVQDTRLLGPITPEDTVIVKDISRKMHTQSLQIKDAGIITEQSLNQAVISYKSLMNSYIGETITLVKTLQSSDQEIRQSVKLLSVDKHTVIVEIDGAIESFPLRSEVWRFVFPKKPTNMQLRPSLTFKSQGKKTTNNIQLNYLTSGLEWQMDYVLELNSKRNLLNLKGLASLFNRTDTLYKKANIKLLAGTISPPSQNQFKATAPMDMMMDRTARLETSTQNIGDLKLYNLPQETTLFPHQQTQVPLLSAKNIPVIAGYRYDLHITPYLDNHETKTSPSSYLSFNNDKESGLGIPLPSGQARIFNPDKSHELQFVGASLFSQSSLNEEIKLETGKAFDFSIRHRQTSHEKTFNGVIVGIQFIFNNSSLEEKTLDLTATFSNSWKIIDSTYPLFKKQGRDAHWKIKVAGNNISVFDIRVRLNTTQ